MKTTVRALAAGGLFLVLAAVLLAGVDFLLTDDIHSYSRVMLQELYASAGTIDTLFLGSSHCYRSVDPQQVDAALGSHSFNAGTSQQLPDGSYYLLREAAEQNDLQTVYLELFYTGYGQSASSDIPLACYLITDYMRPTSPWRYEYLWEMGGLAAVPDLLVPARHAVADPQNLPALWRAKLSDGYDPGSYAYVSYPEEGESYAGRGFVTNSTIAQYGFATVRDVDPEQPLSEFGWYNLQRIAAFCKEENIRLVLFCAPLPSGYLYNTPHYQSYYDAISAFAEENELPFWDFSFYIDTERMHFSAEHFADAHHLSGAGAKEFTSALCDVIARDAAGEDVSKLFFSTAEQKLTEAPDLTIFMKDVHLWNAAS